MARTARTPAPPRAATDPRRIASTTILILTLTLGWASFGPAFLGGPMSMVILSGNSMAPTMNDGDLAVVREASEYTVGDVVAFRSDPEDGGGFVIHRIVGGSEADGFVMQGDNNDWLDPWEPTAVDIVGQLQWHVPGGGVWLDRVRGWLLTPLVMASLVGAAAVMFGPTTRRRQRRRARNDRRQERPMPPHVEKTERAHRSTRKQLGGPDRAILAAGLVGIFLVVAAVPMAWSAWRSPTTVVSGGTGTADLELSYTALAKAPSAVYPEGQVGPVAAAPEDAPAPIVDAGPNLPAGDPAPAAVEPPQPLFTHMIPRIDVHVAYTVDTEAGVDDLQGTYGADLIVRSSEGWSTTVEAVAPRAFSGSEVEFDIPVVFERVAEHLAAYGAATGTSVDVYTVTVVPRVTIEGLLAGAPLEEETSFELPFEVGTEQIVPGGQLQTSAQIDATERATTPATVTTYGIEARVSRARVGSVAGILVGLASIAAAAAAIARRRPQLRHRALYRSLLVDVAPQVHDGGRPLQVSSMDELAKLARRDGRVILHQESSEGHRYFVPDGELTYVYVEPSKGDEEDGPEVAPQTVHVHSIEEMTRRWLDPRGDTGTTIVREESPDGGVRCTLRTGDVTYVLELPATEDPVPPFPDEGRNTRHTNGHVFSVPKGR